MRERAYFALCLVLGRLLQSVSYSKARVVYQHGGASTLREPQGRAEQSRGATSSGSSQASSKGEPQVRKCRAFYAPLLLWMGGPLLRILDAGVVVLSQRDWEEQERRIYSTLYGTSVRSGAGGMLVLPYLAGETLAALLEDVALEESVRKTAIERAVAALAEFHHLGFTHGDAMAANVLVDIEAGVARWFDFETRHQTNRTMAWRRADDLRTLLVTCLVRTGPEKVAETLQLILDVYDDEEVTRLAALSFTSVLRRSLSFHLSQAGLSFQCFGEIARLLRERLDEASPANTQ